MDKTQTGTGVEIVASDQLTTIDAVIDLIKTGVDSTNTKIDTLDAVVDLAKTAIDSIKTNTESATPAGENHIGEVGGNTVLVSAEMTRAADTTAYAANEYVAAIVGGNPVLAEIANFARVNAGGGYVVAARLTTDKKSITPRIRVHLFNASNPTVSADNATWQDKYADISKRLGYFDLPAMSTGADATNSDMSRTMDFTIRIPFKCAAASRSVWFALETLDAFTPASGEKFTLTLCGELN